MIIKDLNIPKCLTKEKMFVSSYIQEVNFENINSENLQTMKELFIPNDKWGWHPLKKVYFTNFSAPNLQSTERMFYKIYTFKFLKLDGVIQNIKISKLVTMKEMFSHCDSDFLSNFTLENIEFLELIHMERMFENFSLFINFTFQYLNFYKSVSMDYMFLNCENSYYISFQNINLSKTFILNKIFNFIITFP